MNQILFLYFFFNFSIVFWSFLWSENSCIHTKHTTNNIKKQIENQIGWDNLQIHNTQKANGAK